MADVLTPAQRQLNMSRIKGKDTKPEMLIRRGLHARGLRYRLHDRSLAGRPDLVFPKYRTAVFIHGCFWHAHGCALSKLPATRRDFWQSKMAANTERDRQAVDALQARGWRVLLIWECAVRGPGRLDLSEAIELASSWIQSGTRSLVELQGNSGRPHKIVQGSN
jgi:DNA mismatch endonuclease (patch repair protein)